MNLSSHSIEGEIACWMNSVGDVPPAPEFLTRVRSAVAAEAGRRSRRFAWLARVRPLLGIAAALLLAVALGLSTVQSEDLSIVASHGDPDRLLADWSDAAAASSEYVHGLLVSPWLSTDAPGEHSLGGELESLEDSFESLDALGV